MLGFFFLSSFVCMLSVASVRLCKAFFYLLVFKLGGLGENPPELAARPFLGILFLYAL